MLDLIILLIRIRFTGLNDETLVYLVVVEPLFTAHDAVVLLTSLPL